MAAAKPIVAHGNQRLHAPIKVHVDSCKYRTVSLHNTQTCSRIGRGTHATHCTFRNKRITRLMALPETSEDFDPRIHDDTRWEQERDPLRLLLEKEPVQVPDTQDIDMEEEGEGMYARDGDTGYLTFFPPLTNLENRRMLTAVGGEGQKIMVYAPGGPAEQFLLFPLLQQIKTHLPNARLDVVCTEAARASYAVCPFVNKTMAYNVQGPVTPADFAEAVGSIKNEFYTAVLTAAPIGFNSGALVWMGSSTNVIGYVQTNGFLGNLFAKWMMAFPVECSVEDPLALGTRAFDQLQRMLSERWEAAALPARRVFIGVPDPNQDFALEAMFALSVTSGEFMLAHGVPSSSQSAMHMSSFPKSASVSLQTWEDLDEISSLPLVFAVPREKEAEEVRNAIPGARVTVVSSPANLAALILLSAGVIAANTIALPIASYLRKPAFGMFESKMIAKKYSYPGVDVITEQDAGPAMLLVNATALRKRVDRLEELHPSA